MRQATAELGVSHQTVSNWSKTETDDLIAPLAAELRQQLDAPANSGCAHW